MDLAMQADRHWLRRRPVLGRTCNVPESPQRNCVNAGKLAGPLPPNDLRIASEIFPKSAIPKNFLSPPAARKFSKHCGNIASSSSPAKPEWKEYSTPENCVSKPVGTRRMIGHTQPRRIAARSIATRLAEELQTQVGNQYRLQSPLHRSDRPSTLIKLMTDGMLLAETQRDRFLRIMTVSSSTKRRTNGRLTSIS